jgi:hypothetical protein
MKNAEMFKAKLGLKRDDKFPFELIPKVEKLLELNINVSGDYDYISKHLYKATVNLLLIDGHYTPEILKTGELLTGIPKMEHILVVFKIIEGVVYCYNGEDHYKLSMNEYKKINNKKFVKGGSGDYTYIETTKNTDIEAHYHKMKRDIQVVKELSGGKIDLSRRGYSETNEALKGIHYYI